MEIENQEAGQVVETTPEMETPEVQTEETIEQPTEEVVEEGQALDAPEITEPEVDYASKYETTQKSYDELRSKFDSNNNDHKEALENVNWELAAYKDYYWENYKMMEALNSNPELLEQLKSKMPDERFSREDVTQMVTKQLEDKFQAQQESAQFDSALKSWSDTNAKVPEAILNNVYKDIDTMNIDGKNNDEIIKFMDMSLAYHNATHQKAIWAKEEQLRQKKVKEAAVWWWTEQPAVSQQPANNDFFQMPRSNVYQWL